MDMPIASDTQTSPVPKRRKLLPGWLSALLACALIFQPLFLAAGAAVQPPDPTAAIIEKYNQSIPDLMKQQAVPGLAIALVDDQKILWAAGYGYTDWDRKIPVTPDTPFSIQSMSKSFTALTVLLAVQEGLLELDAPISQYLPDLQLNSIFEERPEQKITLYDLLSHTAGFTHEAPISNNYNVFPGDFTKHIASISDTWLKFPVGRSYAYSNLGIDLAGYIVQVRSGQPFQQYAKEKLLDSLDMRASSFDIAQIRSNPQRAIGHESIYSEVPLVPFIPSGGLYTSANDMARYLQFHLNKGAANGQQILAENLIETMYTPPSLAASEQGYGLGVVVSEEHNTRRVEHGGGGFGFLSQMMWYPELKLGIVVLTNATGHDLEVTLANQILDEVILSSPEVYTSRATTPYPAPLAPGRSANVDPLSQDELAQEIAARQYDPGAAPGERWADYTGVYQVYSWGKCCTALLTVHQKEDQLLLDIQYPAADNLSKDQVLTETKPGLFFTPDGEVLDFTSPIPTVRNIVLVKANTPLFQIRQAFFSGCVWVFLAALVIIPIGAILRRQRSKTSRTPSAQAGAANRKQVFDKRQRQTLVSYNLLTSALVILASLLGLLTLGILMQFPLFGLGSWPAPTPNMPTWQQVGLGMPYALLAVTLCLAIFVGLARKKAAGSTAQHVFYTVLTAIFAVFILALFI